MTEHVLIEKSSGVLILTLNRPEKKNALTGDMYFGAKSMAREVAAGHERAWNVSEQTTGARL